MSLFDIILLYWLDIGVVVLFLDGYIGNGLIIGIYEIVLSVFNGMSVIEKFIEIIVVVIFGIIKIRVIIDNGYIYMLIEEILLYYEIIKVLSLIDVVFFND